MTLIDFNTLADMAEQIPQSLLDMIKVGTTIQVRNAEGEITQTVRVAEVIPERDHRGLLTGMVTIVPEAPIVHATVREPAP